MSKEGKNTKLIARKYFLFLINDNINTLCDVVFALNDCAGINLEAAYNVGMTAHRQGNSIIVAGSIQRLIKIQKQLKANKLTTRLAVIHGGINWN